MNRFEKQLANIGADAQSRKVLQYMMTHGSINPAEAFFDLGVYRLSGRIHDLRSVGIPIHTERVTLTSERGVTKHYASYSLIEGE